jgi:hypothetical protein
MRINWLLFYLSFSDRELTVLRQKHLTELINSCFLYLQQTVFTYRDRETFFTIINKHYDLDGNSCQTTQRNPFPSGKTRIDIK